MSWREDNQDTENSSDRFVKIPSPEKKGQTTRVTVRILDAEPEGTFRHWHNRRPYNCPGREGKCPVCEVRTAAAAVDKDAAKKQYQMEYVYFFNVLTDGEVKVLSFKNKVATKLREFIHEYGDLRNYDVKITKTKTGPMDFNIDWDVIYVGERELTEEEQEAISEGLHDLQKEIAKPSFETLQKVARGETLDEKKEDEVPEEEEPKQTSIVGTETLDKFLEIVKSKGKDASDYGVDIYDPPSDRVLKALIKEMDDD